jgi:hypothetical protein
MKMFTVKANKDLTKVDDAIKLLNTQLDAANSELAVERRKYNAYEQARVARFIQDGRSQEGADPRAKPQAVVLEGDKETDRLNENLKAAQRRASEIKVRIRRLKNLRTVLEQN